MIHPSQLQPNSPEEEEAYQYELPYIRIYHILLRDGLSVYEPNGEANGVGLECLEVLHRHYTYDTIKPGRARYLKELIDEYKKRWPFRMSNYNLN
jgi:hypothetical protein